MPLFRDELLDWIDSLSEDDATAVLRWLARNRQTPLSDAKAALERDEDYV